MRLYASTVLLILSAALLPPSAQAATDYDGVLSLTPVAEHSCLAVALPVTAGQPIAGLTWIHNDGTGAFPKLLILEGEPGHPPDLSQTSLVLDEVTGESLAWGQVTFETPITSRTPVVYAVFQLPAFTERTGEGPGGGPGIGYVHERSAGATYLSVDGTTWTRLHPAVSLRVQAVAALGKSAGQARALSDLRQSRPPGWWDEIDGETASVAAVASEDHTPAASAQRPLVLMPSPFNPRTTVQFCLENAGPVDVDVYDLRGRRVRSLLRDVLPAGVHEVIWPGVDDRGAGVASGVYVVRLQTPGGVHLQRTALVR